MTRFLYILLAVYLAAVNVYSFMLVRTMKNRAEERRDERKAGNAKLYIAGLLGGAAAAYVALFVMKFRTDSILLMITLPVLAALNVYLVVALLRSGILIVAP